MTLGTAYSGWGTYGSTGTGGVVPSGATPVYAASGELAGYTTGQAQQQITSQATGEYSGTQASNLLLSGEAKTVTEAKAIIEAKAKYGSDVKIEFHKTEAEIKTGTSPTLPRGSELIISKPQSVLQQKGISTEASKAYESLSPESQETFLKKVTTDPIFRLSMATRDLPGTVIRGIQQLGYDIFGEPSAAIEVEKENLARQIALESVYTPKQEFVKTSAVEAGINIAPWVLIPVGLAALSKVAPIIGKFALTTILAQQAKETGEAFGPSLMGDITAQKTIIGAGIIAGLAGGGYVLGRYQAGKINKNLFRDIKLGQPKDTYETAIETGQETYLPILGRELIFESGGRVGRPKMVTQYTKPIHGKPTRIPPEIVETIPVLQITKIKGPVSSESLGPTRVIERETFVKGEYGKESLRDILEAEIYNPATGKLGKLTFEPGRTKKIVEAKQSEFLKEKQLVRELAIEKPKEFELYRIDKPGRKKPYVSQKDLVKPEEVSLTEALGIRTPTGGIAEIEIPSGKIISQATKIAEQSPVTDVRKITKAKPIDFVSEGEFIARVPEQAHFSLIGTIKPKTNLKIINIPQADIAAIAQRDLLSNLISEDNLQEEIKLQIARPKVLGVVPGLSSKVINIQQTQPVYDTIEGMMQREMQATKTNQMTKQIIKVRTIDRMTEAPRRIEKITENFPFFIPKETARGKTKRKSAKDTLGYFERGYKIPLPEKLLKMRT